MKKNRRIPALKPVREEHPIEILFSAIALCAMCYALTVMTFCL